MTRDTRWLFARCCGGDHYNEASSVRPLFVITCLFPRALHATAAMKSTVTALH